jgi:hypothetical protein
MKSEIKLFRAKTLLMMAMLLLYLYAMIHGAVSYNMLGKVGILWAWLFVSICTMLIFITYFYKVEVNK